MLVRCPIAQIVNVHIDEALVLRALHARGVTIKFSSEN